MNVNALALHRGKQNPLLNHLVLCLQLLAIFNSKSCSTLRRSIGLHLRAIICEFLSSFIHSCGLVYNPAGISACDFEWLVNNEFERNWKWSWPNWGYTCIPVVASMDWGNPVTLPIRIAIAQPKFKASFPNTSLKRVTSWARVLGCR
jgi:hypothetical protein